MVEPPEKKKRIAFNGMKAIRNSVLPYAFRWGTGLGAIAAPATMVTARLAEEVKINAESYAHAPSLYKPSAEDFAARDTVPELDAFLILNSGQTLSAKYPGITQDEHGTLEVSYTFDVNKKAMSVMPDSTGHDGETDICELTDKHKKLFLKQFDQISDVLDIRFVKAADPDSAYLTCVGGDLSNYYNHTTGKTGAGGYAQLPNKGGSLVVMDHDNMKNPGWAQVSVTHEIGHVLGLCHPHYEPGKMIVLSKVTDNLNATVMSYENSTEESAGGMIANEMFVGRSPKGFQYYDWAMLGSKYGWSRDLAKEQRHVLGCQPEVYTLVGGREKTQWEVDTAAGPSFIDMNSGVKHPSSVGPAYYWSYLPVSRVEALNHKDNVFVGNSYPNIIVDGDGSSVFSMGDYYNVGVDSLYTGKGEDVIQIGPYTSSTVIMDYDPTKDRIEYDEKYISDYKVTRSGKGAKVKFKGEDGKVFCDLELPTVKPDKVGEIVPAKGRIVTPFANRMTAVKPGQKGYVNFQGGRWRIFNFPNSVKVSDVVVSYQGNETQWRFMGEEGEDLASVAARGRRDVSKCQYIATDQFGIEAANYLDKVRYEGVLTLPDGSTLQTDSAGVNIRDFRNYGGEASPNPRLGESVVLGKGDFCLSLQEKNYVHREEGELVLSHLYRESAINWFDVQKDTLTFMAETMQVVDCGNQRAAVFSLTDDGEMIDVIYINQERGKLESLKVKSAGENSNAELEFSTLSELNPKLQEQVVSGMEWAAQRQENMHILLQQKPPSWQQHIQAGKAATRQR